MEKYWLESKTGLNNASNFGMSSARGCQVSDLPTDVKAGSTAFDYTTKKLYTFDGTTWN